MKEKLRYFKEKTMVSTNGMALGLFGTLIIGTILGLLAKIPHMEGMDTYAKAIQSLMGAGIGLGVALALKREGIAVVTAMACGFVGNYAFHWINDPSLGLTQFTVSSISDPLSCYLSVMLALLGMKFILRRKTPVDLLLVPLTGLAISLLYSFLLAEWVHFVTIGVGKVVEASFAVVPFLMCIIVSALVGMALTAPISSVAVCVAIQIGNVPLAACSALIGCCVQMVGFAYHTSKDNKWGSVLAVGLGTSMLQFKNIVRKPIIWLPTIIVSALLGPFAMLFPLESIAAGTTSTLSVGAGMGTSGLVGPINFLGAFGYDCWQLWLLIIGVCIIAPIGLVAFADFIFRKAKLIEAGDFALGNNEKKEQE